VSRAARLFVRAASRLAPRASRRTFIDQWDGELSHYAQWLARERQPTEHVQLHW